MDMSSRFMNRLTYLVGWCIVMTGFLILGIALIQFSEQGGMPAYQPAVIMVVGSVVVKTVFLDIPRLLNMGWSPWLAVFSFVPALNIVLQVLLFIMPPDGRSRNQ